MSLDSYSRVVAVLCVLVFAPHAAAEEGSAGWPPQGLSFGLRAGYALPAGLTADDAEEPYLYSGLFSLWAEAGYRFDSGIEVGPWVQYARAQIRGICPDTIDCRGRNLRLGVLADYHFKPQGQRDAWLGLGLGYED
jgi:hypothetical protein